ncbi:MAG: nucleotidyltransferase family protein [Ruminococcus sp.]|nr:nucleotidyltransferase family protein [Ruminococcus sp.]
MRIACVICEFNPFHNGHKYLIDRIKSEYADCVIAIMSGNFVQRGDVAIVDKYQRAETALKNGCDLVVELPTVFALSSAEHFAKGGVAIADALNSDILCFGAEYDNIETLKAIAEATETDDFKAKLKEHLANGEYYPKAVYNSVANLLGNKTAEILNGANNTLAIEYIKALNKTSISPIAIKRKGASHDSNVTFENIASATHIRNLIRENKNFNFYTESIIEYFTHINKLETAILYKLKTMSKNEIENLPDVSEGLHNRIFECARNSNSLEELFDSLKTKRYTLARLRRIVIYALLGITKDDMNNDSLYIRVLGMNDKGSKLLKNSKLPLVCKFPQDYNALNKRAKRMLDIDLKSGEVFSLSVSDPSLYTSELKRKIIKT